MPGIESISAHTSAVPNYVDAAWSAAESLDDSGGRPLQSSLLGLAINSPQARTQDQLHIHIGCLRRIALKDLARIETETSAESWTSPMVIGGSKYRIRRLYGATLTSTDPPLLSSATLLNGQPMSNQTLVPLCSFGFQVALLLSFGSTAHAGFCTCPGNSATVGDKIVFDELNVKGLRHPNGPKL